MLQPRLTDAGKDSLDVGTKANNLDLVALLNHTPFNTSSGDRASAGDGEDA